MIGHSFAALLAAVLGLSQSPALGLPLPSTGQSLVTAHAIADQDVQLADQERHLVGYDDLEYVDTLSDCRVTVRRVIDDWIVLNRLAPSSAQTDTQRVRVALGLEDPKIGTLILLYRRPVRNVAHLQIFFDGNERLTAREREALVYKFDLVRLKQKLVDAMKCAASAGRAPFVSVAPCTREQYVAPALKAEQQALRAHFAEDLKLAWQTGDKESFFGVLCRAAAMHVAEAEKLLGASAAEGALSAEKDDAQARYWLTRASGQGSVEAAYQLSRLLLDGRGGPVLAAEGIRLLRIAADANVADAQLDLAGEYATGDRLPRDRSLAQVWGERARRAGHPKAEAFLNLLRLAPPQS